MSRVLALEPDRRQAAIVTRVVREHVRAELTLVDSRDAALAAIAECIPDVILLTALLSPRDEDELFSRLRALPGSEHVQTHTIPQLAASPVEASEQTSEKRVFGRLRKKKSETQPIAGCNPEAFAQEICTYLQRAAELKALGQTQSLAVRTATSPSEDARATVQDALAGALERMPATPGGAESSSWSSPFQWRPSAVAAAPEVDEAPAPEAPPAADAAETLEAKRIAVEQEEAERQRREAEWQKIQEERRRIEIERREADAERQRLEAEAAAERARRDEEARAEQERREAEAAAARERDAQREREAERLRVEAARDAERVRMEAEREAERLRQEAEREKERLRVEAEREAERVRVEAARQAERLRQEAELRRAEAEAEAAAARQREAERLREEAEREKERLRAEAAAEKERLRLEAERVRLEAERLRAEAEAEAERVRVKAEREAERVRAAAARQREAEERRAREAEERRARDAEERRAKEEAAARKRSEAVEDAFAEFRLEGVEQRGILHLVPLAVWARVERPPAVAPQPVEQDDFAQLMKGLSLPAAVAGIAYPRGCRIRRVRVPALPESTDTGPRRPLILSRETLNQVRAGARRG